MKKQLYMKQYVMSNDEAMSIWTEEFPILSKYSSSAALAQSDIMLIGLRFLWGYPEHYMVSLDLIPLWGEWRGIDYFILSMDLQEFKDRRGRQIFPDYTVNNRNLIQGPDLAYDHFGNILEKEVSLKDLFELIDICINLRCQIYKFSKNEPIIVIEYLILKMALAAYSNNIVLIENVRQDILNISGEWNEEEFFSRYGKSVEEWRKEAFRPYEDREGFMRQIEINRRKPKIAKLKHIQITGLDEPIPYTLQKTKRFKWWPF